jgi:hypothetical protein
MKKLLNIDLHISVIADIIDIFKRVDENIIIEDWCLSGHNWVLNKPQKQIDILNQNTWTNLDINLINNFTKNYDTILKSFDGFICCYPVSFILLFEKYNKPIYVFNAVRYDMPFCWNNNIIMIQELHNCFRRLQDKDLLTFISNNKADNAYFKLGNPNINTQVIPSLCLYTNMKWNPQSANNKFLLYSGSLPFHHNIIDRKQLGRYKWDTLMTFKGIIHFPYEASTMSIFEHISSEIPLFFPSKSYLKYLWVNKKVYNQMNYWEHNKNKINPDYIPDYLNSTKNYDFWIERADYYDIEGYYYFNSLEHLYSMIDNFKDELYEIRKEFIRKRKSYVIDKYKNILI